MKLYLYVVAWEGLVESIQAYKTEKEVVDLLNKEWDKEYKSIKDFYNDEIDEDFEYESDVSVVVLDTETLELKEGNQVNEDK